MTSYYAGIGARSTPGNFMGLMRRIASKMEQDGWILRTGGARGADTAFEEGVSDPEKKQVFVPWHGYNGHTEDIHILSDYVLEEAMQIAASVHPAWHLCKPPVRLLHARNVAQLMGPNLDELSKLLICWTPNGAITGGTGNNIRLAERLNIPIKNLADIAVQKEILAVL